MFDFIIAYLVFMITGQRNIMATLGFFSVDGVQVAFLEAQQPLATLWSSLAERVGKTHCEPRTL